MVHGLLPATITGRCLGETPFVQISTTWVWTCLETVHKRPCTTKEIETWLSDSRVGNNSVVGHRSRRPDHIQRYTHGGSTRRCGRSLPLSCARTCPCASVQLDAHADGAWVTGIGHEANSAGDDDRTQFSQLGEVRVAVARQQLQPPHTVASLRPYTSVQSSQSVRNFLAKAYARTTQDQ